VNCIHVLSLIIHVYGTHLGHPKLVTAIKSLGGPTVPWCSGRVDALDPSAVTPDGRLPNADSGKPGADKSDADHLREIFGRMGKLRKY